jgi:tetratricopeptide (TPR) repeat protein
LKLVGLICVVALVLQASPDEWYALGVRLSAEGKPAEAIAAYRHAVQLNPRHVDAWNNLGDLLRRSGQRDDALDALRHALAVDPQHARAALNLALTDIELHHFKEALPLIETAHQGLGDLPVFDYLFARVHLELNDYEAAAPYLLRFRQGASPSIAGSVELAAMLLERSEYAPAVEVLLAIPAERRSDDVLLRLAQGWYGLDQLEKARDILVELSQRVPADFSAPLWLSYTERGLGNAQAAYDDLQQALKLRPESGEALVAIANLELERNDAESAASFADRALKLDSQDNGALLVRGLAFVRLDRPEEALGVLTKIPKQSEAYRQAVYALSKVYRQLGQVDNADAAIREFQKLENENGIRENTPTRRRP